MNTAPATLSYLDRHNREVRSTTQGFDGRWIYKDSRYDTRGNVDRISRPYYVGDPVYWIDNQYDDLSRLVQVIEPDNLAKPALIVNYNDLTVSRVNRKDQATTEIQACRICPISVWPHWAYRLKCPDKPRDRDKKSASTPAPPGGKTGIWEWG